MGHHSIAAHVPIKRSLGFLGSGRALDAALLDFMFSAIGISLEGGFAFGVFAFDRCSGIYSN